MAETTIVTLVLW